MTSELSGAPTLLQTGPFKNWTSINEITMTLAAGSNYFPANANSVYLNQTEGTDRTIELPHPLQLNDGQSRMWFCFWKLSGATLDSSLTFVRPAAVTASTLYALPATQINRLSSNFVVERDAASAGDTRTEFGFVIWCTTSNNYYIAAMGDAANFTSIVAGTGAWGQTSSNPTLSGGDWSLNVFAGSPIWGNGDLTAATDGFIGPLGYGVGASGDGGYWIMPQAGTLGPLHAFIVGTSDKVATFAISKNGTPTTLSVAYSGSGAGNGYGAKSNTNSANAVTVVAGDRIEFVVTATAQSLDISLGFLFRPGAV